MVLGLEAMKMDTGSEAEVERERGVRVADS